MNILTNIIKEISEEYSKVLIMMEKETDESKINKYEQYLRELLKNIDVMNKSIELIENPYWR